MCDTYSIRSAQRVTEVDRAWYVSPLTLLSIGGIALLMLWKLALLWLALLQVLVLAVE